MAARTKRPNHTDSCREKIQASQLINRLQNHALTSHKDKAYEKAEMTDSQVRAALGLLKKTTADLSNIEIQPLDDKGNKSNGFEITVKHVKPN